MTPSDLDYLARRERESLAAALFAADPCAQAVHAKLARAYRARRLAAEARAAPIADRLSQAAVGARGAIAHQGR